MTVDTYSSKLDLLSRNDLITDDFKTTYDDNAYEKVHTKFLKFALGLNKFSSNHAIRAELGRFPICINTNVKLVKY